MKSINSVLLNWVVICVMCLSLSSCHFGRSAEELRPTFEDRKRNIEYSFKVGFPFASTQEEQYSIEDFETEGLHINWNVSESLAVFGKAFVMEADTLEGEAAKPYVLELNYDARRDGTSIETEGVKTLDLSFTSWAKQGEGETFAQPMPIVYPYSKVLDKEGKAPKAEADSLMLSFNGQDGMLQHLRDTFFVAMGKGIGMVNNGLGSITTGDESAYVKLTPKFAIVRLALVVEAERPYTLNDFISSRSVSEGLRYISEITLENKEASAPGFNQTILNLSTGVMKASANAQNLMVLTSKNAFTTLTNLPYENQISLAELGADAISWGTMLYLAIPCTDEGGLTFEGELDVSIKERKSGKVSHLYGKLKPVRLEEGGYYLSSSINLSDKVDKLVAAEVVRVK